MKNRQLVSLHYKLVVFHDICVLCSNPQNFDTSPFDRYNMQTVCSAMLNCLQTNSLTAPTASSYNALLLCSTLYITHSFFPPINHIWTREQHGVSILPKDTSSCRLEEPRLEPPTARLAENLLNILSYSHQSLACCVLNASSPKNTVNTVKCSPVLNTSCT